MKCPYCNEEDKFSTLSSRARPFGVKRVRKCLECGYNFATIEIYKVSDEALKSLQFSQSCIETRATTKERKRNAKV